MNIFILGGECSGKTTLINKLLLHCSKQGIVCSAVYEYLRHYCCKNGLPYHHQTQYAIACMQHLLSLQINKAYGLNFIDTSALLTGIYSQLFLANQSNQSNQSNQTIDMRLWHLALQQHSSSLNCKTYVLQADIAWQQDGCRTSPNSRTQTFEQIIKTMQSLNLPFTLLKTSTAFDVMIKELTLFSAAKGT